MFDTATINLNVGIGASYNSYTIPPVTVKKGITYPSYKIGAGVDFAVADNAYIQVSLDYVSKDVFEKTEDKTVLELGLGMRVNI